MSETSEPTVAMRNRILGEWNHRCAVCGEAWPHIHHIDGNHSNNEAENLIPLCPNHHLIDQHNPTRAIEKGIMALFRQFKDPAILTSEFQPLYQRIAFLNDLPPLMEGQNPYEPMLEVWGKANDLVGFVSYLTMGEYYSGRLRSLLLPSEGYLSFRFWNTNNPIPDGLTPKDVIGFRDDQSRQYRADISKHQAEATRLVIEALRYQRWRTQRRGGMSVVFEGL